MKEEITQKPKVKAMCLFVHDGKTLTSKGFDKEKNETFYRLIGGGVDFGESSAEGIRREIREELGCEIESLALIEVIENVFTYEGKGGHEIVFLYKGDLANKDLYNQKIIRVVEPHSEFDAEWVSTEDIIAGKAILYPAFDYSQIFKWKRKLKSFLEGRS